MKFIKVESCRTCPFIVYDDGKGMSSEFWKCGKYGIMLIDKDIYNALYTDLDTIHPKCQLDTQPTDREITSETKTRRQIAREEATRDPIFLFQQRMIIHTRIPRGYEYDDGCHVVKSSDNDNPNDPEELNNEEMLERHCAVEYWRTETVFATRGEGEEYGRNREHRYPDGWHVYCVPCEGSLKHILEEADCKEIKAKGLE